ncbi:MAG TPA: hypothetical protein DEO94_06190 [Cyanobacteria bacterium UBA11991]|nr:ClpX C4-type zinc finger protein [Cyanobacteriota bacterium]MDY6359428.1 ClpX C4-type zinc finger protein [Cyanobacteriota bacterium]MDY6363626.1 ClpX C4-type zinc finger protein [Cyanobacteriota bacterium]MDY6382616.1 ClpX C4-type zinc finger protein [Cyanobacteriota bacterium]HCB11703.1 hypothetical protein [Cyanobacteria bacterium UBA11991]
MSDDKVVSLGSKKKEREQKEHEHNHEHENHDELVYCSFCKRPNTQVIKMIQGPGVNICSECVMIALQYLILQDRVPSAEAQQILNAFWGKAR